MAEVTGDIGGQPVQLNNAATETTLQQLLATMLSMAAYAKGSKGGGKSQEELEDELRRLAAQSKNYRYQQVNLNAQQKSDLTDKKNLAQAATKEIDAKAKSAKVSNVVKEGFRSVGDAAENVATELTGLMNDFASMGNSMTSAAAMFKAVPGVGTMLAAVLGAVAGAAEKTYKTFQQSASVGANFNGNLREMIDSAGAAGLTLEQFGSIISKNGENLMLLGGTTTEGAKRLAKLGKDIRNSELGDQLARLGYSTEAINNGFAVYSGMLAKSGGLQNMSNKQLIASTGEYLKNLDAVSRLTGQSKESLQQQEAARMKDAQFRIMLARLGDDGKNLHMILNSLPLGLQEGAKEVLATGTATTKAGEQFIALLPDAARDLQQVGAEARRTGKLSTESAIGAADSVRRSSKGVNQEFLNTAGSFNTEMAEIVIGILDARAQIKTLGKVTADQTTEVAAGTAANKKNRDALDPAAMKTFQERLAELSNQFTKMLAENLPKLITAFGYLESFVNEWLVPSFKLLMENIEGVIIGLAAFKGAMLLMDTFSRVKQFIDLMREAKEVIGGTGPGGIPGIGTLGTRLNPMYVIIVGDESFGRRRSGPAGRRGPSKPGGPSTPSGPSPEQPKSKIPRAGTLGKGAGIAAGAISAYELYDDLSDIAEQEKEGKITTGEAKEKKGEAVGGAVGATGGAWGGSALGAAIGTAIFPGVGTAAGWLIGGALGGWAGKEGGEYLGKEAVKATGPSTPKPAEAKPAEAKPAEAKPAEAKPAEAPAPKPAEAKPTETTAPKDYNDSLSLLKAQVNEWKGEKPKPAAKEESKEPPKPAPPEPTSKTATPAMTAALTPVTPSTLQVQTAIIEVKKGAESENSAEMKKIQKQQQTMIASIDKEKSLGSPIVDRTQESAETLLASLNSKMDQLIKINYRLGQVSERQLTVQQGLTNDLFVSV